jgi:hypothetical protein
MLIAKNLQADESGTESNNTDDGAVDVSSGGTVGGDGSRCGGDDSAVGGWVAGASASGSWVTSLRESYEMLESNCVTVEPR